MKNLTAKQQERLEKKKKKMCALSEIIKLNDQDRISSSSNSSRSSYSSIKPNLKSSLCSNENGDYDEIMDNLNDEKTFKRISKDDYSRSVEPKLKKQKLNEEIERNEINTTKQHTTTTLKLPAVTTTTTTTTQNNTKLSTDCDDSIISDKEYNNCKREINEKKRSRQSPKYRLRDFGELAQLSIDHDKRTPIFLTDIQHLIMAALIGSESPCSPSRWCSLEKVNKLTHCVVLVVEGISLFHFLSYQNQFAQANDIFNDKLEVVLPTHKESNILQELITVPLTNTQKDELIEKYGSLDVAIEMNKDPIFMVKTVFPIASDEKNEMANDEPKSKDNTDKFPRTKLLLSALQMVDEGYPLPLRGKLEKKYEHYHFTKSMYAKVTPNSPLFGVDCEMCRTSLGINELTRISIVNEDLQTVYESLVRPNNRIVDYLTKYSGITAEMMMNVTNELKEVQNAVKNLLPPDAILVGQSLNSDLHAMQMMHPYVIDTSVIFNITGERRRKTKLQILTKKFLGETIQENLDGHDSVEDSLASLKLTKLKLQNGLDFGDAVLQGKNQRQEFIKEKQKISNNLFACVTTKTEKTTAIVTAKELSADVMQDLEGNYKINSHDAKTASNYNKPNSIHFYKTDGNKAAIHKVREIIMDNSLTIANVNIPPQQLELSRIEKSITYIDKWIGKLYKSMAQNGMFIVLLGGSFGSTSGVALITIKKNSTGLTSEMV